MRSHARIIAEGLYKAGCRHAFGMPGGEVLVLMDALDNAGIHFHLCKHENAAGIMAEGTYNFDGAPGILLTTIGPGLANAVNSIANAFQEQVPLIVLSGCVEDREAQRFTHQIIDQTALMKPITKAQFQVSEGAAHLVLEKALAIAMADPPGPVHIDMPHNIAPIEYDAPRRAPSTKVQSNWQEGEALDGARAMLSNSDQPILIAGLGALHHDAGKAILDLCEQHRVPFLTTYKAKGIVDENHPLCLGGHGLSPKSDEAILPLLQQSDCIILAGYDPIEMRGGWIDPFEGSKAIDIRHCDINHGMHGARYSFTGNVANGLNRLCETRSSSHVKWLEGPISKAKAELQAGFYGDKIWGPHQIFSLTNNKLPDDVVTCVDSGAHRILLSQIWKAKKPRKLLQSSAFCTMGVSLPLAIGYATALSKVKQESKVLKSLAFVGDAGLEMVVGELATIRDKGLPVIVIVLVDQSLALIELKQSRTSLPNLGVDFGATDFVKVAQAYGGRATLVSDNQAFEKSLDEALEHDGWSLIACAIGKEQYRGAF